MSSPLELIAASGYFVKWMEDIRLIKQRLLVRSGYIEFFELLEKALGRMRSKTPTGSALPQTVEIVMLPETKALAETAFSDGPSYLRGNKATGVSERKRLSRMLRAQLPTLLNSWHVERKTQLIGLLNSYSRATKHRPQDPLSLALAVFRCTECSAALRWPTVICHPHLYTCNNASQCSVGRQEPGNGTVICGLSITDAVFDNAISTHFRSISRWTLERLELWGDEMARIISACGSDPATADTEQLDRINVKLACSLCSESGQRVLVMGWRSAVRPPPSPLR